MRKGGPIADLLRELGLTRRQFASLMDMTPADISKRFNGTVAIDLKFVEKAAEVLLGHEPHRKRSLIQSLSGAHGTDDELPFHRLKVRVLEYGHLSVGELKRPITPGTTLTGPTGFLIDLFRRFSLLAGASQLVPEPDRARLGTAIYSLSRLTYLGNLATIERLNTDYFFCTPISVGIQGIIRLEQAPAAEGELIAKIRRAFETGTGEGVGRIAPIYMRNEVASHLVRAILGKDTSVRWIDELDVASYANALESADCPDGKRIVMLADELTCLLVLKTCTNLPAVLAISDGLASTRFPFGFSIFRPDAELRGWFKAAWQFYIQTDASFITNRYVTLYKELVTFATDLNYQTVAKDYIPSPEAWASRLLGVETRELRSSLVSSAWAPIVESVYKQIH